MLLTRYCRKLWSKHTAGGSLLEWQNLLVPSPWGLKTLLEYYIPPGQQTWGKSHAKLSCGRTLPLYAHFRYTPAIFPEGSQDYFPLQITSFSPSCFVDADCSVWMSAEVCLGIFLWEGHFAKIQSILVADASSEKIL